MFFPSLSSGLSTLDCDLRYRLHLHTYNHLLNLQVSSRLLFIHGSKMMIISVDMLVTYSALGVLEEALQHVWSQVWILYVFQSHFFSDTNVNNMDKRNLFLIGLPFNLYFKLRQRKINSPNKCSIKKKKHL